MTTNTAQRSTAHTFRRLDLGGISRTDDQGDTLHAATLTDHTPEHRQYPTGYDSACGWCWLNAPHTEAAHAAQVTR